jgi:hypothetical protein
MEDPAEQLIRRALGRRPPPELGPTLARDVMRRVAERHPPAVVRERAPARRWLAVPWLLVAAASLAVLVHLEWSSGARAVAWAVALGLVPLTYLVTLWPDRALSVAALCGGPLLAEPQEAPPAVTPASPSRSRDQTPR